MIELRALGTFDLLVDGRSATAILSQPKRAALLAYLVLARPGELERRDSLLALFWPDLDESHGRNALSQALTFLRRELGEGVILTRGASEVGVVEGAVHSDVRRFERAVAERRWPDALSAYGGTLLPGLNLGASDLDPWLDEERARLRRLAAQAGWSNAAALLEVGDLGGSETAARHALALAVTDESSARDYITALAARGHRARALGFFAELRDRLARDLDVTPDAATEALVASIQRGENAAGTLPSPGPAAPRPASADPPGPDSREASSAAGPRARRPAALAALAGAALLWVAWPQGPTEPATEGPLAVAILPFSVSGAEEAGYLEEGMVDLLAAKLAGAHGLRPIDAQALAAARKHRLPVKDRESLVRLALDLGANAYIQGTVLEAGGRLQIAAGLHDAAGMRLGGASVEGPAADLFRLVDALAGRLLASLTDDPLVELATTTTSSLEALKHYLDGERALRAAQWASARNSFRLAIDVDSTFVLALYRYAITCGWAAGCSDEYSLDRALPHLDGAAPGIESLIRAQLTWVGARPGEAEDQYRALTAARPEDFESWSQLGEVLFHSGPFRGRPITESVVVWNRVAQMEPDHPFVARHMAPIASMQYDTAALALHVESALRHAQATGSPPPADLQALAAIARGDSAGQAVLISDLPNGSENRLRNDVFAILAYARDLNASRRFGNLLTVRDRTPYVRILGRIALAHLEAGAGRFRAAIAQLDSLRMEDPGMGAAYAALMQTSPYWPASIATTRQAMVQLEGWRPEADGYFAFATRGRFHEGQLPAIRAYLAGCLAVAGDDLAAAGDRLVELTGLSDSRPSPLVRNLRFGLEARILARSGRARQALAALDSMSHREIGWIAAYYYAFADNRAERYLRAHLLATAGQDAEAERLFASTLDNSPLGLPYLAPSMIARAEIHEARGEDARARELYRRALDTWADADPELAPVVSEIRDRVRRLSSLPRRRAPG